MQLMKRFFFTLILAMPSLAPAAINPGVQQRLAALAVPFVPNAGQWDEQAAFAAQTFAGTLFVTKEGKLVYRLLGKAVRDADGRVGALSRSTGRTTGLAEQGGEPEARGWVLTETMVNAQGQLIPAVPTGAQPQVGKVSFAIGSDESRHRDRLPSYERVNLGEAYPGINIQLRATGTNVEKIFTVAPGSDPGSIQVRLDGAQQLELGPQGELIAHTGNGPVTYTAPIAYQEDAAGKRSDVPIRYALNRIRQSYGFTIEAYDATRPLVIDPLLQSTYLGGSGGDIAYALAIHPATGEVYATGFTTSTDFPTVEGAEQSVGSAEGYAFVTRFNAALTTRLQSTYLGGNGSESAIALAIHPTTGEIYITGYTSSTDFPKVAGAEQAAHAADTGQNDAFVTRLSAPLTSIVQSTYLGGTGNDVGYAITIHPVTGEVYVAGSTDSTDIPKVAGAEQTARAALTDGFITRLNAALTTRLQSTYLGGNGDESVWALAIHPVTGDVNAVGNTTSPDFPKIAGAEQTVKGAGYDVFVTRLNPALTVRLQSTYLGGNGDDRSAHVAIHPASGAVYVAGYTASTDLPKVSGSEQAVKSAGNDGFITVLSAALTTRMQSTYLGGGGNDTIGGLAIHPATGDVYVAGSTDSTNFPKVANGIQTVKGTGRDGFVTRVNAALTTRLQSTYLGGDADDAVQGLAIHPATGEIYVGGATYSTDLPQVAGAEQTAKLGTFDAFVSRVSLDLLLAPAVPTAFSFAANTNVAPGSLQTSDPAQILGVTGSVPISVVGGNFAQFCVSSSGCLCDALAYGNAPATLSNAQFVCVRQIAPLNTPALAKATVVVGGNWADFLVTTGTTLGSSCTIDADGNGANDALTDGLIILRAMFGLTGTSVTNGAIGGGASRGDWATIRAYLNGNCGTNFAQ